MYKKGDEPNVVCNPGRIQHGHQQLHHTVYDKNIKISENEIFFEKCKKCKIKF